MKHGRFTFQGANPKANGTTPVVAKTKSTPSLLKQSLKKITKEKRRSKSETDASPGKGVLIRSKNDTPLLKNNSGHRASPRAGSPPKSPASSKRSKSREQPKRYVN